MNVPFNKKPNIIFAALVPLLIALSFVAYYGKSSNELAAPATFVGIPGVESIQNYNEIGDSLVTRLYREAEGENRSNVLMPVITEISLELCESKANSSGFLIDVLTALSVSHPNDNVRLAAYRTMLIALDIENDQHDIQDGLAMTNEF